MNKKLLLSGILVCYMMGEISAGQKSMQVWLNNGENYMYPIEEVDSITFSDEILQSYMLSDENTMPPVLNSPRPLVILSEEQAFVKGNNEFGKKCLEFLPEFDQKNMCFSPFSLNTALGICANTAQNKGVKEIGDAMGFDTDDQLSAMNKFYNKISESLNSPYNDVDIRTRNAFWIEESIKDKIKEEFVETLRGQYYSTIRPLNFINDPQGSKDTINKWADLMTEGRIKELSMEISDRTRAVINNATYFKGQWIETFYSIGEGSFQEADSTILNVPMIMTEGSRLGYYKTDDYEAVDVAMGKSGKSAATTKTDCSYSMVFLLPREGKTLKDVLPNVVWEEIPFTNTTGNLTMPKFNFKAKYILKDVLQNLGIKDIFKDCNKGFKGCPLYVSDVTQDTYIKVDEKGAEAAAVSSIIIDWGSAITQPNFEMIINRPYAFAIKENNSGLLLFIGIVNTPEWDEASE